MVLWTGHSPLCVAGEKSHKEHGSLLLLTMVRNRVTFTAVISHTRPPTIFSHFETYVLVDVNQIKTIHDNNGDWSFQNHYFSVSSRSIRVALSSLLHPSINRN